MAQIGVVVVDGRGVADPPAGAAAGHLVRHSLLPWVIPWSRAHCAAKGRHVQRPDDRGNRPRRQLARPGARPGVRPGAAGRDGPRQLSRRELPRRPPARAAGRRADRAVAGGRGGDGRRPAQRRALDLPRRPCRLDPGVAAARRARRRARHSRAAAAARYRHEPAGGSRPLPAARPQIDVAQLRRTIACVKATSFVSEIAPDLVPPGERALFMYATPRNYIASILAGENSGSELRALAASRAQRLARRVSALWAAHSDAELAAVAWACEMTALEAAAACDGRPADRLGRLRPHARRHARAAQPSRRTSSASKRPRASSRRSPPGR